MPLSPRYSWKETCDCIIVTVPWSGKSIKKVDIYQTDQILKISHTPFLLDLTLFKPVDYVCCNAFHKHHDLILNLKKAKVGLWGKLIFDGNKEAITSCRQASIRRKEEDIKLRTEKARSNKVDEERTALKKQMEIEEKERQHIENLKAEEKKTAEDEMYESVAKFDTRISSSTQPDIQNIPSDREVSEVIPVIDTFTSLEKENIRNKRNSNTQSKKLERNEHDVKGKNLPKMPNPRQTIRLTFKHTPRIFKTPVRESALKQEEDFIAKNGPLMRTSCHFNVDSLDISENDPFWLKKKGDIFLKGGDYLSAINAYTASFDTSNESIEALAERSLCYLHLGNLSKCICDCEKVLQLMDKKHELESRNICKYIHIRMGCAYCQKGNLDSFEASISSLYKAFAIDDSDKSILDNIEKVKRLQLAYKYKQDADIAFKQENVVRALDLYNKSISTDETFVCAHSNVAAVYFTKGHFDDSIKSCNLALEYLRNQKSPANVLKFEVVMLRGSKERLKLEIVTLSRRGAAYLEKSNLDSALSDLVEASKILQQENIQDEGIEGDICAIKEMLKLKE